MQRIIRLSLLLIVISGFLSSKTQAAQNGFEVMSFRPTSDNGRYFSVWDSQLMDKGEWDLGTTFDYNYRPLQITKDGEREAGVLDKVFEQHLYASIGVIKKRLEIGIDLPIGWWLKYRDQSKTSLGDLAINAKIALMKIDNYGLGISIVPFITIPTGKSDYFLAHGVLSAGASLIAEFNPFERLFVAINLGLLAKKNYTLMDIDDASKLTGGLGLSVSATKNLKLVSDLLFKTRLSGLFREKAESPLELLLGAKYNLPESGFILSTAFGGGLINGAGAPQYRILFGLGYSLPSCKSVTDPLRETKDFRDDIHKTRANKYMIHFNFNSVNIESRIELKELDKLTKILLSDKTKRLLIEGHADNIGTKPVNNRISKQRANTVAEHIVTRGINKDRMSISAYGSDRPIADNNTKQGRKANRRVELVLQEGTK
jgi:outer membrane protein OmpA-like peptidoglycan-associated protein